MTEALIGDQSIADDIKNYGLHSPYTQLNPGPFHGDNPDNAEGEIPYEKGFQFLYHIEHIIGVSTFHDFLRFYFPHNSQQSLWDFEMLGQLRAFLEQRYGTQYAANLWEQINVDDWLYGTGPLPQKLNFQTQDAVEAI